MHSKNKNKEVRRLVREVLTQEDFGDWVKDKSDKAWNTTKKVGKAFGRETKETLIAARIFLKLVRGKKEPTKEEIKFLKNQTIDFGKALVLIGLQAVPGSSVAIIALEKALKKHGLTLFPKEQEIPNEITKENDEIISRGIEYGINPEIGEDEYEELQNLKDAESNRLDTDFSIILKADDSAKSKLISLEIPEEPNGNEMTKLPDDKLHATLTSIKSFKPFKEEFKDFVLPEEINAPDAILGEGKFVYRDEQGKVTYVIALENQNEFKEFVDKIYNSLGLENPEPDRFYHITVANNAGGNPFKSIGDVVKSDF